MTVTQLNNGRKPKRWVGPNKFITPEADAELAEYPKPFRQILFNRGLDTAEKAHAFLEVNTEEYDPFLMKGMREAVDLIKNAIRDHEPMVVYGDYDVDGVTATALLVQALESLGGNVEPYIPNRFDEGYGLNCEAVKELASQGKRLIITVDCGIRSVKEADVARELGVNLIISDHHHPLTEVPAADAVICPRQVGDEYPYKELAGVGIAYKIARALFLSSDREVNECEQWLDLVALGTVSDIAPLTGENRLLVKKGLHWLQSRPRQGIYSLMMVADIRQAGSLTATDIGFKLGPRLNAAGRMESAQDALKILMTDESEEASLLAQKLQVQNADRQEKTTSNQKFAEEQLGDIQSLPIILAFGSEEDFHSGIVGLVAARLVESHYRPAVVGVIGEKTTRASCRSIDEFHITKALDECKDLLVRHGGHSKAAGFTVENENLEILSKRLLEIAGKTLKIEELISTLKYDAEIDVNEIDWNFLNTLEQLEPTGNENPRPVFRCNGVTAANVKKIGNEKHLRFSVNGSKVNAIAFNMADWADHMPPKIDLVFYCEKNWFRDLATIQLNVRDIRPAESQV
ncbi:MAG: single-stranded-DNA-specific exonuclease RecJ [Chloroflexi bacterium]|nr:single-stranded-DNA-specific exonuclease RecJ [Chloroflexota bacterium]